VTVAPFQRCQRRRETPTLGRIDAAEPEQALANLRAGLTGTFHIGHHAEVTEILEAALAEGG